MFCHFSHLGHHNGLCDDAEMHPINQATCADLYWFVEWSPCGQGSFDSVAKSLFGPSRILGTNVFHLGKGNIDV